VEGSAASIEYLRVNQLKSIWEGSTEN